jgi:hypothetical protein
MGMNPSPPKIAKPYPPAQKTLPQNQIITDPNAILAKLNNKNNEFISAFNASVLSKTTSNK